MAAIISQATKPVSDIANGTNMYSLLSRLPFNTGNRWVWTSSLMTTVAILCKKGKKRYRLCVLTALSSCRGGQDFLKQSIHTASPLKEHLCPELW